MWCAEHNARTSGYWNQQWRENKNFKAHIVELEAQVLSLRMRFVWVAGIVLGASFVGNLLASFAIERITGNG